MDSVMYLIGIYGKGGIHMKQVIKKAITAAFCVTILLSLSACGNDNTQQISEQLQGTWTANNGNISYEFNNDRFLCSTLKLLQNDGYYIIRDKTIELLYDNGVEGELTYTFDNQSLSISSENNKLEKEGADENVVDESPTSNAVITTASEAIQAVKDYWYTNQKIAEHFGYKNFYEPEYGTCTAVPAKDGSINGWKVTLKGNMNGYVDDYHSELENQTFTLTTFVTDTGIIYP